MRLVLPRRYVAKLELHRDEDLFHQRVEVAAEVAPSADGTQWEVGPVDCCEWLTFRELEEAKDLLAGLAQVAEMCG